MKKRKWTFWSFETNEMGALSMYLEQMAEKGWFPDKIGEWGIVFYEGEPEQRRYAAAFVPRRFLYNQGLTATRRGR